MKGAPASCDSSSGGEEEDPRWKEAIDSVASASDFFLSRSKPPTEPISSPIRSHDADKEDGELRSQAFNLYQIKAQKLLGSLLDNSLEMVETTIPAFDEGPQSGGIRLFRQAPPGIIFDPIDVYRGPVKRPRILPAEEISEKSKKFRCQVRAVAVDGNDIVAAAKNACQLSLARFEAKEAAAKAAAKREEERVAELKRIRGEKWLPSLSKEHENRFQGQRKRGHGKMMC